MKKLLLSTLLVMWTAAVAKAQDWAAGLPVDSASGRIVYQGSVEAGRVSAAALRRRAVRYTAGLFSRDTLHLLTGSSQQQEGRFKVSYQVTIWPTTDRYRYELYIIGLTYPVRVGEGAIAGRISPIVKGKYLPIDQLRDKATRPVADLTNWQVAVERVAQRVIAEVKTTMLWRGTTESNYEAPTH
jgi:hypothetical protein